MESTSHNHYFGKHVHETGGMDYDCHLCQNAIADDLNDEFRQKKFFKNNPDCNVHMETVLNSAIDGIELAVDCVKDEGLRTFGGHRLVPCSLRLINKLRTALNELEGLMLEKITGVRYD